MAVQTPNPVPDRNLEQARYRLFENALFQDQRVYYQREIKRRRKAAAQVNQLRAVFAFITGLASALAGLIVMAYLVPGSFVNNGECALTYVDVQEAPVAAASFDEVAATEEPGTVTLSEGEQGDRVANTENTVLGSRPSYCDDIQRFVGFLTIVAIVAPVAGAAFTTLADLFQWDRVVTSYETALENLQVADAQSPLDAMDDVTYKGSLDHYIEGALSVMRDETAQWGQLIKTPDQVLKFIQQQNQRAANAGGVPTPRTTPQPQPPRDADFGGEPPSGEVTPLPPDDSNG
jgi:hypothetical protein